MNKYNNRIHAVNQACIASQVEYLNIVDKASSFLFGPNVVRHIKDNLTNYINIVCSNINNWQNFLVAVLTFHLEHFKWLSPK